MFLILLPVKLKRYFSNSCPLQQTDATLKLLFRSLLRHLNMKVIWLNNKWKMEDAILTATHLLICISKEDHECCWQLPVPPRYETQIWKTTESAVIREPIKCLICWRLFFLQHVHDAAVKKAKQWENKKWGKLSRKTTWTIGWKMWWEA